MSYTGSLAYKRSEASGKLAANLLQFHAALYDLQFVLGYPDASMNEIVKHLRDMGYRAETLNGCGTIMKSLHRNGCVWMVGKRRCRTGKHSFVQVYTWKEWQTIQPEPPSYLTLLRLSYQEFAQHRCPTCHAHHGSCKHSPCPGITDSTKCACGFADAVNELFVKRSMKK